MLSEVAAFVWTRRPRWARPAMVDEEEARQRRLERMRGRKSGPRPNPRIEERRKSVEGLAAGGGSARGRRRERLLHLAAADATVAVQVHRSEQRAHGVGADLVADAISRQLDLEREVFRGADVRAAVHGWILR